MKKNGFIKTYSRIIICIFLFLVSSIVFYTILIEDVCTEKESIKNEYTNNEFEYIYDILLSNIELAKDKAQITSDEIENQIKLEYPNKELLTLQNDLDNGIYPTKLLNIFENNIKGKTFKNLNNSRNGMLIVNADGIICDMNIGKDRESLSYSSNIRLWKYEFAFHDNKILTNSAITKLIDQSNDMIVWDNGIDKYNINNGINKYILKEIYLKDGIEGFKNYDFLCAAYINEYSDIFGQEDLVGTKYTKTHKFIVIQKINLYDIIVQDHKFIADNNMYDNIDSSYDHIINSMYVLGLFLCLGIIGTFYVISILFNRSLDEKE